MLLCAMSTGDADSFRTFEGDLQFTTADPGVVYAEGMWKARLLCARVSDFGGLQLVMGQLVFDTRVDLELIEVGVRSGPLRVADCLQKMLWPLVFDDNVGAAVREQIEHVQTAITDATARLKEGRYYDVQLCIDRCKYDARDEMVGDRVVRDILAEMKAERERLRLEMKELLASADKSTRYV